MPRFLSNVFLTFLIITGLWEISFESGFAEKCIEAVNRKGVQSAHNLVTNIKNAWRHQSFIYFLLALIAFAISKLLDISINSNGSDESQPSDRRELAFADVAVFFLLTVYLTLYTAEALLLCSALNWENQLSLYILALMRPYLGVFSLLIIYEMAEKNIIVKWGLVVGIGIATLFLMYVIARSNNYTF